MRLALVIMMLCLAVLSRAEDELAPRHMARQLTRYAAQDFTGQASLPPAGVRMVRFGQVRMGSGPAVPALCGEFLPGSQPAPETGQVRWIPFATLKTSDYEQWQGLQAQAMCDPSNFMVQDEYDYAAELQAQIGKPR